MSKPLLSYLGGAAAEYARRGWPVLPLHTPVRDRCSCQNATCQSIGKHSRTRHGLRDATTDLEQITTRWRRWPHANIGIATRTPSRLAIIDVDPHHGGEASLRQLNRQHRLPRTAQADKPTPRQQRYFRQLAEQTGTSFTPPPPKAQASREITRLESLQRSPRADRIREQRAVQADLQAGAGDSVRHRRAETRGYGSSARWAHGTREADR